MVEVIQAGNLTLYEVETKFNLQQIQDPQFFPEWQVPLPELAEHERYWLDQTKADWLSLLKHTLHEEIVKLAVVAPVLSVAGLCRSPFVPAAEKQVEITNEVDDQLIRGRVDLLMLHGNLWVATIETKPKQSDVLEALPQLLFYMMANPLSTGPMFGLLVNGNFLMFVKLVRQDQPRYGLSEPFTLLRHENDLYRIVSILKSLKEVVLRQDWQSRQVG